MEAENSGKDFQNIYEDFQKMRDFERKKMEELGLVDAENTTKDLHDAIVFRGTCTDMCPVFERIRRALENNVKSFEKDPATNKISRARAVKAFSRPAAGQPPPMPSDVRPPHILQKTLDYIVDNVIQDLPEAHSFIWDRTRSIRQDFTYQNFFGPEAIDCNERIVRIHLLSLHVMAGSDIEYSQQQELEQLNKALQTLTEIYQDVRNNGGFCPNEAEFRAYHLVSHFRDPELEREIQKLPNDIISHPSIKLALRIRGLMSQNNVVERGYLNSVGALNLFVEFFRLIYSDSTPFLLACLLETHFNEYRFYALKAMVRSYHTKGKAFHASALRDMLGFDSEDKVIAFVSHYDVDFFRDENGVLAVDLCNKEKLETKYKLNSFHDKPKPSQAYSAQLDQKSQGFKYKDFINLGASNSDLHLRPSSQAQIQPISKPAVNNIPPPKIFTTSSGPGTAFGTPAPSSKPFTKEPKKLTAMPTSKFESASDSNMGATGFGSNQNQSVGSLNLSQFLNGKKSEPQLSFGSIPKSDTNVNKPASQPPSMPSFNTQPKALGYQAQAEKGKQQHDDKPGKVTFGGTQTVPVVSNEPPSLIRKESPQPGFFPSHTGNSSSKQAVPPPLGTASQSLANVPNLQGLMASSQATSTLSFATQPKKKLQDDPHFPGALREVSQALISQVVDTELKKLLPRVVKHANRMSERTRAIDSMATQLFQAFMDEIIAMSALESIAKAAHKKTTLRKFFGRMKEACDCSRKKKEFKKQKMSELQSITFKQPALKREYSPSSADVLARKRLSNFSHDISFERMAEKRKAIDRLWSPLDLQGFAQKCSNGVRFGDESVSLKFLLIVEDWSSPYSKWLNTKFALKVSADKRQYENEAVAGQLELQFQSLPKANRLQAGAFEKLPFIIFESGLFEDEQLEQFGNLQNKLIRDMGVLKKLAQICGRFALYRVQILVLVWDILGGQMSTREMARLLQAEETKSESVQNIVICDMSSHEAGVSETLQYCLYKLGDAFKGSLTSRGLKKRLQKVRHRETPSHGEADPENSLMLKEKQLLDKAKDMQKHNYLLKHAARENRTMNLSNSSFRTAADSTVGNFSNNNTLINLNNTFLNNSTATIGANQVSMLGSIDGNNVSVLEESTPFGSPRPKAGAMSRPPLPKKVQELKDLVAAVKDRYRQ